MTGHNTIGLKVAGGLGNQMFQYAAGRALALRHGATLSLDIAFYSGSRHRTFELDAFPIVATVGKPPAEQPLARLAARAGGLFAAHAPVFREHRMRYDPAFADLIPPIVLKGYFQSPRYFADAVETIRAELAPPKPVDDESRALAELIAAPDAAALHVRRGDYVSNAKVTAQMGLCPLSYYEEALRVLPGEGTVLVFSDDIEWARANLPATRPLRFVGEEGPRAGLADLWLMTRARHHILANSSFSWWGAFLASRAGGATIAPARWFADPEIDDSDLVPSDWIRI